MHPIRPTAIDHLLARCAGRRHNLRPAELSEPARNPSPASPTNPVDVAEPVTPGDPGRCARFDQASDPVSDCADPDPDTPCLEPPDSETWTVLVARLTPAVRLGIHRALARRKQPAKAELVDELSQETWCRLLADRCRRLRAFRGRDGRTLAVWTERIAYRLTVDHLRARRARKRAVWRCRSARMDERIDPRTMVGDVPLPEARIALGEWRQQVRALCGGHPRGRWEAKVVELVVQRGWTTGEVARLGRRRRPVSTIDSVVHRARRRLEGSGVPVPLRHGGCLGSRSVADGRVGRPARRRRRRVPSPCERRLDRSVRR